MVKKLIWLIILILILLIPRNILANEIKTIIIVVDELSFDLIDDLKLDKYNLGLVNLKGIPPYSKEGLFLSINTGQKIEPEDFYKANSNLEFLGDCLKEQKTSFIGGNRESLILVDRKGEISYKEDSILYELDWLVKSTDKLLNKSSIFGLAYDFNKISDRLKILKSYLEYNKDKRIFILPQNKSLKGNFTLNKYLVPIIYINGQDSGILTSSSTQRKGFITIEDISVHIKKSYGYFNKSNIGREIQLIPADNPLKETVDIYNKTMNLLIITYIFHGIAYAIQIVFGIWILKTDKIEKWIYNLYLFAAISIIISFILGLFQLHRKFFLYLFVINLIALLTSKILKKKENAIFLLNVITYILISVGIIFFPNIIYNSYIGFNNLVYGARYYGLNNGIAAILLGNSILIYYKVKKIIKSEVIKELIGILLFILNIVILSTVFGSNFGGFITAIILFGLMVYLMGVSYNQAVKRVIYYIVFAFLIILVNLIINSHPNTDSHLVKFLCRLKENGVQEFIKVSFFKIKENIKLTIIPPFSIVIISQVVILRKLSGYIRNHKEVKSKAIIIIIIALLGFTLNDTGVIFLIYIIQYLILDILNDIRNLDKITPLS